MSRTVTIQSLPPELLDYILDFVRGPGVNSLYDDGKPRNADLRAAALVSRE